LRNTFRLINIYGFAVPQFSEAKKRPQLRGKTNIGVLIDADVWRCFRMHCLKLESSIRFSDFGGIY
jgi:hypothetical protein